MNVRMFVFLFLSMKKLFLAIITCFMSDVEGHSKKTIPKIAFLSISVSKS